MNVQTDVETGTDGGRDTRAFWQLSLPQAKTLHTQHQSSPHQKLNHPSNLNTWSIPHHFGSKILYNPLTLEPNCNVESKNYFC